MPKLNRPNSKPKLNRPTQPIKRNKIDKSNPDWYWNLINGGDETCYVCERPLRGRKHTFVGYHKFSGEKLKRCEGCEPGSEKYLKKFGSLIIIGD